MEVYRTEEEQVEAIKRWWGDNGKSIVTGIALAVALVFGWQAWDSTRQNDGDHAAALFTQLQDASRALQSVPPGESAAADREAKQATFRHIAKQIKDEHAGSTYSVMAAMLLARDFVEAGDAASAEKELKWALEQKPSPAIKQIVDLRLARVLSMKGEHDAALKLLDTANAGGQKSAYEELKGDIYFAKGDIEKARAAYQAGLDVAGEKGSNANLLKIKLDDLAVAE